MVVVDNYSQDLINQLLDSGHYRTREEVIQTSLELLSTSEEQLVFLKSHLAKGLNDLDKGNSYAGEEVFDDLLERRA